MQQGRAAGGRLGDAPAPSPLMRIARSLALGLVDRRIGGGVDDDVEPRRAATRSGVEGSLRSSSGRPTAMISASRGARSINALTSWPGSGDGEAQAHGKSREFAQQRLLRSLGESTRLGRFRPVDADVGIVPGDAESCCGE